MSEASTMNPGLSEFWRSWLKFALVSAIFFQVTAATFTSLGVVLPYMIEELSWSWSGAGIGFSVLSFMVGISSRLPSWTLRQFGTRATFGVGGVIMAAGHCLLASTHGLYVYFAGAALAGLGYTMCALIPGVKVIQQWLPRQRSFAIGAYMMIGGLGGVAGPLFVTGTMAATDSWRMYWLFMAGSIALLAILSVLFLRSPATQITSEETPAADTEIHSKNVHMTKHDWHYSDAVRTPQFYIIVAALTITLLGGVTTNTWAVTHMGNLGIALTIAAGALSAHALINSTSRAFGGLLATRIDPKWLLASALVGEIVGMLALSSADNMTAILLFAIGEGYGFGMCMFATTVLLINYFGPAEAPRTMGTMYLIATLAMLGPSIGGFVADAVGGFTVVFRSYALILLVCLLAVVFMRPPTPPQARTEQASGNP